VTNRKDELTVLARGLDQASGLLDSVGDDDLATATACAEWTVSELVDHLVASPANFAQMVRGGEVDWSAPTPHVGDDRADVFRAGAGELLEAWHALGDGEAAMGPDWQSAEIAVHSYDLAGALGRPTASLDQEVAERGLAFMQANLKPEIRGPAFGPEQPAPDGADAYQLIAAFAGRTVTPSR
jgi:uncharacterized protein (TIGR03086 family)